MRHLPPETKIPAPLRWVSDRCRTGLLLAAAVLVAALCGRRGYRPVLRSEHRPCTTDTGVFIGDSMGELPALYARSAVAFVGGTLVPVGGHNLLEPILGGRPVLFGPHTENGREMAPIILRICYFCFST